MSPTFLASFLHYYQWAPALCGLAGIAILSLVIYLAMIIYIFVKMRKKDLIAYCVLFFLVTLSVASNIVFPIGAFMNERFLFMPSLGYCILLGVGFIRLSKKIPGNTGARASLLAALMVVTLSLYGWKTVTRNMAWYDSYTLFTTDVKVSANSAKSNEVAGEYILQKATGVKDKVAKDSMLRLSIAYQLARLGVRDIVVLERGYLCGGASGRNGGGGGAC